MPDRQRTKFETTELALVLSHFDLGVIESITELGRGSTQSAKAGIVARKGKFVLKRRSKRRSNPDRVAFSHRVQQILQIGGFPAPRLITPRTSQHDFVQLGPVVYELFEFIPGHPFSWTAPQAREAGELLAQFHGAVKTLNGTSARAFLSGDYHDTAGVCVGLQSIGNTLNAHESFSGDQAELAGLIQFLLEIYDESANEVNALGIRDLPEHVIHADWHPGNLLFRGDKIVAALDYDSVRPSQRIIDVANGILQFSMAAGDDPVDWPDHVDEQRLTAFLSGYEATQPLNEPERRAMPGLMIEALIAECVPPINETGSMGRWSGFRVLQMIRRKVQWLHQHGKQLISP